MAAVSYPRALARVLVYEGGYTNHPDDPGGVTLEGVIQRVFDAYCKRKGLPVRPLTPQMRGTASWNVIRDEIYREQYWDLVRGDMLPAGLDLVVFDGAVNSGPTQSIKWLQRALGVPADGDMGEVTIEAIKEHSDILGLIDDICDRRLAFLKALKTWPTFGNGWGRRVADVRTRGKQWARSGRVDNLPLPRPAPNDEGTAKAPAPIPEPTTPARSGGLWAIIVSALSSVGSAIFAALGDWRVVVALACLVAFIMLFLGREWLRKLLQERL